MTSTPLMMTTKSTIHYVFRNVKSCLSCIQVILLIPIAARNAMFTPTVVCSGIVKVARELNANGRYFSPLKSIKKRELNAIMTNEESIAYSTLALSDSAIPY